MVVARIEVPAEQTFLEWESAQPIKHELLHGMVFAFAGANRPHNVIAVKVSRAILNRVEERGCEVYQSDMRVEVSEDETYTYPDIVVVCDEPQFRMETRPETLLNPLVIFEILSPSTELIDRNLKLDQYLALDSLAAYLLVAQDKPRIESYSRQDDGWRYQQWEGLAAVVHIEALDIELPLREVYRLVPLDAD